MSNASPMIRSRRTLPFLIAALASLHGAATSAAGLGELITRSSLGEPLRAEVRVFHTSGESIEAGCVKVVGGSTEDIPWIRSARVRLDGDRLVITTRDPVNHPIALLGLRVGCGFELHRDFALLLSPPLMGRTTSVSPPVAPMEQAARPGDSAAGGSQPPVATPAARPDGSRTASPRPAPAATRPAPARKPDATPPPPAALASRAPRPIPRTPPQDRLLIGVGAESGLTPLRLSTELANPPRSDEAGSPHPRLNPEQRTVAEIDDRISAQLEVDEKIKRLEEYQALLKERLAQLDPPRQSGTTPPVAVPAAPPQSSGADDPGILEHWSGPAAGLLAVMLGVGALLYLRHRRNGEASEASDASFHTTLQSSAASGPDEPVAVVVPAPPVAAPSLPEMRVVAASTSSVAHQGGDAHADWVEPTFAPAHPIPFDETVDEQDSALELAEIMMSFGRTQGAAETLADYIRNNPRQAVKPWLKLLEVYHVAGMRAEFEALTRQLNKTFNVKMISWNDFKALRGTAADSIEQIPHIIQRLQAVWGTQEAQVYIHQILRDNRNGTRQGFTLAIVEELLLLLAVLDDELGTYKPSLELSLVEMEPPTQEDRNAATA